MSLSMQKIFYLICLGPGLTLLVACADKQEEQAEVIRPVRFEDVRNSSGERSQKFTGITKADQETELSFKVGGTIVVFNIESGKRIAKGALIAKLDSGDARLKLDKQKLSMGKTKAQMETALSNLNRIRGLYENNNVSLGEYEAAKEKFSNADASYETEKRAVDLISREFSYYQLHAPAEGIVLSKDVSINENVQAGQVIAVIQRGDALSVEVGMPEQFIVQIKKGQKTKIELPSISNTVFEGIVTEVAYTVSGDSSTYPVTVTINQPTNKIRPGMPANVLFNFSSAKREAELVVPAHSVAYDEAGNFVFLVVDVDKGIGKVKKVPVVVGRLTDRGFEITKGIAAGDKIITAGISSLEEGMSVKLLK